MSPEEVRELPNGLYRFFWHDKSLSVGAVGRNGGGEVWFAITNWINPVPHYDWENVPRVELITTQEEEQAHANARHQEDSGHKGKA